MGYEKILKKFREVPEGARALAFRAYLNDAGDRCAVGLLFNHDDAYRLQVAAGGVEDIYLYNEKTLIHDALVALDCDLDELADMQRFADQDAANRLEPEGRFVRVLAWLEERAE